MNRSRASLRLTRRQTKNSEKTADVINGSSQIPSQNGQILDDIDLMFSNCRSKLYPIYTPPNKKVNPHNLAEIPSLQSDEDSIAGLDNVSQNSDTIERNIIPRKQYGKRKNVNGLIESRNKFRQLLNQMQNKIRPNYNGNMKSDSIFDGYDLKNRRVKFEPKKLKKDSNEQTSPNKISTEFSVKLFEKSVDLTNYCKMNPNQYISLYPICRIWSRYNYGLPDSLKSKRNLPPPPMTECPDPDGPYSDSPIDVYHLPKPEPLPKNKDGNPIILRIPERVREGRLGTKSSDTSFVDSMTHLNARELIKLNMPSWKRARKENLEALRQNERRYRHSFAILKSIFDKANNDNPDILYYKYPPYESDQTESQSTRSAQKPS